MVGVLRRVPRTAVSVFLTVFIIFSILPIRNIEAFAQEDLPTQETSRRINVELVVDASGSMAAITSTGEMRFQAAQRVLSDVVQAIPEAEGVNVGLRVYGHQGDNTDAGRGVSCQSTELLVPVDGVDRPALISGIDSLAPIGWTPLGLALQSAGNDLSQPADDGTVNAIVMVTDGLETCDGDPVSVAGQLHSSSAAVTTYVVGFGTTPDEQEILNGIANAGGGQLFGAENAAELNAALFSILEELEIVVGAGFVGGNAFGVLPSGTPGEVSVIGFGNGLYGNFPVVVKNDIGQDVSSIKVAVTIRDATGNLLASGDVPQGLSPRYVRAGGVAIGAIYLGPDFVIPPDAQVDFKTSFSPAAMVSPYERLDLDIVEAGLFENRIVGTVSNGQQVAGTNSINIQVLCFDMDGTPVSSDQGFLDQSSISPGETASFQVDLLGYFTGQQCPAFLVTGSATRPASMPASTNLAPKPTVTTMASAEGGTAEAADGPSATPQTQEDLGEPPYPLPTQDPALANTYTPVLGVENAVARAFVDPADSGIWIQAIIASFDSPEHAAAAVPIYQDRNDSRQLGDPVFTTTLERVDVDISGFESPVATVYTMNSPTGGSQYVSLLVAARENRLYVIEYGGYQPGFDQRTVDTLVQVVENPLPRANVTDEITYGLWGELPLLAEVPAGFQLDPSIGNYVPRSFGPISPSGQ